MNNIIGVAVVSTLFACSISSCNEVEDVPLNFGYNYFPLETGHFVIYDVDSIVFNDFTNEIDSFHYQKMHVIDSAFLDNSGRQAFKLIRYQRANSSNSWFLTDVWYAVRNQGSLEVVEENQRFVKLLFPPDDSKTWNGNQYIDSLSTNWWFWAPSEWRYSIVESNVALTLNNLQFDSTLTVLHQKDSTLIQNVYSVEKFAREVGMVYKKFWALDKRGDITRPWSNPESGFILTMTIIEHGQQ